jgi:hypothetical protein
MQLFCGEKLHGTELRSVTVTAKKRYAFPSPAL